MDEKIIEKIIENEIYAPVNFADCEKTDWGILFFDEHNPACISANHAVITDPGTDLFKAAVQTRDFYLSKSLLPRIETPFCGLTGENQIKALERAGFFREYRHKAKQSEAERKAAGVFKSILKEAPGDEFSDHPDRFEKPGCLYDKDQSCRAKKARASFGLRRKLLWQRALQNPFRHRKRVHSNDGEQALFVAKSALLCRPSFRRRSEHLHCRRGKRALPTYQCLYRYGIQALRICRKNRWLCRF